ncbi:dimethylsulfoxide reductase, partial [Leptospira kmetyi]
MNTHDVPMILFTVVTQMCVGAFLVLGTVHVGVAIRGRENSVVERTSRPVLYA